MWHKHRMEPIAVDHTAAPFGPRRTIVLSRCACGHLSAAAYDGCWTLAQVRGETGDVERIVPLRPPV